MSRCAALSVLCAGTLLALCACSGSDQAPARPQWKVVVTTDAPIPQVGDRLLVELLNTQGQLACTACRRSAVVGNAELWPVSFGIEATSTAVYVRTRLYRGDRVGPDGQPSANTTIDFLGQLPSAGQGITLVGVHLVLDCIAKPADLTAKSTCLDKDHRDQSAQSLSAPTDHGPHGGVGTTHFLSEGLQESCPAQLPEGMACVKGGLFFLGDALAPVPNSDVQASASPEQLVGLKTFLLDQNEVSVADFYSFLQETGQLPAQSTTCPFSTPEQLRCKTPSTSTNSAARFCTYEVGQASADTLEHPPASDSRPINCISWELAQKYCAHYGKRLPTEAEWEYAASNGSQETRFAWGNQIPSCEKVYLGRGITSDDSDAESECLPPDYSAESAPGLLADTELPPVDFGDAGTEVGDKTGALDGTDAGSSVVALAGNVSEWTSTLFEPYGTGCWNQPDTAVLLVSPNVDGSAWCTPTDPSRGYSVRGGAWTQPLAAAWSANRAHALPHLPIPRPAIGFRCAQSL